MPDLRTTGQLIVSLTIFLQLLAGCSSAPVQVSNTATAPTTSKVPQVSSPGDIQERLNQYYAAWRGVPYKIGGNDKRGIDCSGFVHLAYKNAFGIKLPRSTKLLSKAGKEVSRKQLAVGDLVFFKTGFAEQHVGIYMGGGHFIHASTSKGVMKSALNSRYWSKHYWKSTRVLEI